MSNNGEVEFKKVDNAEPAEEAEVVQDRESSKEAATDVFLTTFGVLSEQVFGVNLLDITSMAMPENPIADVHDYPHMAKWFTFIMYQCAFIGLLIYFIYQQYHQGRTSSFITLDNSSGVCLDDPKSVTCCEVPQSITGTFLADTSGKWNTEPSFSYIQNNYAITVGGLEYTTGEWAKVMQNISDQVKHVGLMGVNRDYAWNLVGWGSFTAQNLENGFLQFYASGRPSIIYDKQVISVGYASALSDTAACDLETSITYNSASSIIKIESVLCTDGPCKVNPCENITAPEAMGYDPTQTVSNLMTLEVSMEAATTALAVNMGMIELNHLVEVPGDNNRLSLMKLMTDSGAISLTQANHTSSYYDSLNSPTKVIYCHSDNAPYGDLSHTWISGRAFCFIRIGNTLAYPVTTSYGWSYTGYNYPTKCTAGNNADTPAATYYCNLMDVVFGFVYYPVPNLNPNHTYTLAPTRSPTRMPTPGAGQPSRLPTHVPTFRPTVRPTARPTPLPGSPTFKPSYQATLKPTTARPTPVAGSPTFNPTFTPTKDPSFSANPTLSFRPTVSLKPTAKPSVSFTPTRKPTVAPSSHKPSASPTTHRPTHGPTPARRLLLDQEREFLEVNQLYFRRKLAGTDAPSDAPTVVPSDAPTDAPSDSPTEVPTEADTESDTQNSYNYYNNYNFYNHYNFYYNNYYNNYYHFYTGQPAPYYQPIDGSDGQYYHHGDDQEDTNIYSANMVVSDFTPVTPVVFDNGKIYAFAEHAAKQFDIVNNTGADIYVANIAYNAMIDTIFGTSMLDNNGNQHSYANDFSNLCSSDVDISVQPGCAVLAFEIYGGNDRAISTYYYQPSSLPAFSNTLWMAAQLKKLEKNTPTSLIQTYYSCVLAPWPAFYAAVGLGFASVSIWVPLAFAIYMLLTLHWLNYFHGHNIPGLKAKEKAEAAEKEARERDIDLMLRQFRALRQDVSEGHLVTPNLVVSVREEEEGTTAAAPANKSSKWDTVTPAATPKVATPPSDQLSKLSLEDGKDSQV